MSSSVGGVRWWYNMSVAGVRVVEFGTYHNDVNDELRTLLVRTTSQGEDRLSVVARS